MRETSKSKRFWQNHWALVGRGIDVGAGDDPMEYVSRDWDKRDGDAELLTSIRDKDFDYVYSSHCLEHLNNVGRALINWQRVARHWLYVVVPDFRLYEKGHWPSRFNQEHKHTFSITETVNRINHWQIIPNGLRSKGQFIPLNIQCIELQHFGYDFAYHDEDQTMGDALAQIRFIVKI